MKRRSLPAAELLPQAGGRRNSATVLMISRRHPPGRASSSDPCGDGCRTQRTAELAGFVMFCLDPGQARGNSGALLHRRHIGRIEVRTSAVRRDYADRESFYHWGDKKTVPRLPVGKSGDRGGCDDRERVSYSRLFWRVEFVGRFRGSRLPASRPCTRLPFRPCGKPELRLPSFRLCLCRQRRCRFLQRAPFC